MTTSTTMITTTTITTSDDERHASNGHNPYREKNVLSTLLHFNLFDTQRSSSPIFRSLMKDEDGAHLHIAVWTNFKLFNEITYQTHKKHFLSVLRFDDVERKPSLFTYLKK